MAAPSADRQAQYRSDLAYDRSVGPPTPEGAGWLMYSVVLLSIAGALNLIGGIAAVSDSHFYVHNTHYMFGSLNAWGWTVLIIGAVQLLVALGITRHNQAARWVGVIALGLNAIAQLLMIPAYPFWSLSIFALDLIAIYGLTAYGAKAAQT
jgi:hypothetical protein